MSNAQGLPEVSKCPAPDKIATLALYILRGVGVILHKCKPYDLKCLLGKNITKELNKTIYIYKEHKIMFQVDMKNYGIYENT